MANIYEPTPEQIAQWNEWVAERPPAIREVAAKFPPWGLYRLKSSGHRVTVYSFQNSDPVTMTVLVLAEYNLVDFERGVFGIPSDDLEPCELPGPDEPVGARLSQEEVRENLDQLRVEARPDLWYMGDDGKAYRRDN